MTCRELYYENAEVGEVNLRNFWNLHPEGQRLIRGWFQRAWNMRDCPPEDKFEAFIYAWIAFNGWAACVTGQDMERGWTKSLACDTHLCQAFAQLEQDSDTGFGEYTEAFSQDWPVFKAQSIRRQGLYGMHAHYSSRSDLIEFYLREGITDYQPGCWVRHRDKVGEVPGDWPHTLAVLYRVRCNLFHGEKAAHSEMDSRIVANAVRVMVHFLAEPEYISVS